MVVFVNYSCFAMKHDSVDTNVSVDRRHKIITGGGGAFVLPLHPRPPCQDIQGVRFAAGAQVRSDHLPCLVDPLM